MDSLILVTGAPGWLGNRLVRALIEGLPDLPEFTKPDPRRRVRCLVLPGTPTESLPQSGRLEIVKGDVRVPDSLDPFFAGSRGAVLFHLAGIIHPRRRIRELFETNVQGTKNVLSKAIEHRVQRIIAVSSNSPLGANPHPDHRFDESSPYHPYLAYGRSKKAVEDLVNQAYQEGKIETVLIRPCWFYGPEQPRRQSEFFEMIARGRVPVVGSGQNLRSLSYVDNTCQGLLLAAVSPRAPGQTYWIADRRPYTMNEIVDTIEQLMETEFGIPVAHKRIHLPNITSEVAYFLDVLIQALGFYHQKIHVLSEMNKTIACSIAKAERELGYDPKIELEEGMRRSIRWWLNMRSRRK